MEYRLYKLSFRTGVHFGSGGLTKGQNIFYADTLFSALYQEALRRNDGSEERLLAFVNNGSLRFSDGLPFIGETFYIPRPVMELEIESNGGPIQKKAIKKLDYLPADQLDAFLNGKMDIEHEADRFRKNFGTSSLVEKAAVAEGREAVPYAVYSYRYKPGSGLYVLVGSETGEAMNLTEELLRALSATGIGGKISSGYGKFNLSTEEVPSALLRRLKGKYSTYMLLTTSLPAETELSEVIPTAAYKLVKRSGFIASPDYADQMRKKKDMYLIGSGSTTGKVFEGAVFDVSEGGKHPVYRYARPVLMGVI